jgi:hypothetical protein
MTITDEMIAAGVKVLNSYCAPDGLTHFSDAIVKEIFEEMRALEPRER